MSRKNRSVAMVSHVNSMRRTPHRIVNNEHGTINYCTSGIPTFAVCNYRSETD